MDQNGAWLRCLAALVDHSSTRRARGAALMLFQCWVCNVDSTLKQHRAAQTGFFPVLHPDGPSTLLVAALHNSGYYRRRMIRQEHILSAEIKWPLQTVSIITIYSGHIILGFVHGNTWPSGKNRNLGIFVGRNFLIFNRDNPVHFALFLEKYHCSWHSFAGVYRWKLLSDLWICHLITFRICFCILILYLHNMRPLSLPYPNLFIWNPYSSLSRPSSFKECEQKTNWGMFTLKHLLFYMCSIYVFVPLIRITAVVICTK